MHVGGGRGAPRGIDWMRGVARGAPEEGAARGGEAGVVTLGGAGRARQWQAGWTRGDVRKLWGVRWTGWGLLC